MQNEQQQNNDLNNILSNLDNIINNDKEYYAFVNSVYNKIITKIGIENIIILSKDEFAKRVKISEENIEDKTYNDEIDLLYSLYTYNKYVQYSDDALKDNEDFEPIGAGIDIMEDVLKINIYNILLNDFLKEDEKNNVEQNDISYILRNIIKAEILATFTLLKIIPDSEKYDKFASECLDNYKGLYTKMFERYYNNEYREFPYDYILNYDKNLITFTTTTYIRTIFNFFSEPEEDESDSSQWKQK